MFNLIFQDLFGCYYQLLPRGIPPLCSCGDRFVADDHVRTYQLITSNLEIHFTHWRGLLMRLGIAIPPNFDDPYDILHEVTRLCMRGEFVFYKMPELGFLPALSMGNGWGYCFVRGPRPHLFTDHELIIINSKQEAEALLASVNATEVNLRNCAELTLLFRNLFDYSQSIRPDFIELLVERKLLAYKVPVRMAARKVKAEELVDATGAGNRPVPLGPETKIVNAEKRSVEVKNPELAPYEGDKVFKRSHSDGAEKDPYTLMENGLPMGAKEGVMPPDALGIKEFPDEYSQLVKSEGYPDILSRNDYKNFSTLEPKELPPNTKIYRIVDEGSSEAKGESGCYWAYSKPANKTEWRSDYAVKDSWNDNGYYVEHTVGKDGLKVWEGKVAGQRYESVKGERYYLQGGETQLYVKYNAIDNLKPKMTNWADA